MYSPLSDMQKMFYAPEYLLFRVTIDNKEHLGRVNMIDIGDIKHPSLKRGSFLIYDTINDFKNGIVSNEIDISPKQVIGIEAIDTVSTQSPTPLTNLLAVCNELEAIPSNADIGIIKHNIPSVLDKLITCSESFATEHPNAKIDDAKYFVSIFSDNCKNASYDLDVNTRIELIRDTKEGVSYQVHMLIKYS